MFRENREQVITPAMRAELNRIQSGKITISTEVANRLRERRTLIGKKPAISSVQPKR